MSLFQTVVMMLYNDADKLSYAEIAKATGIETKELKRTLQVRPIHYPLITPHSFLPIPILSSSSLESLSAPER